MKNWFSKNEAKIEFSIRKATMDDVEKLTALVRNLGTFEHMQKESFEQTRAIVERHLALCLRDDSHLVLCAEDEAGEILGYTSVHWNPYLIHTGPEGYVSELFVQDFARGRGVGARLLDEVKQEARQRGCDRLLLLNVRSRESYKRGFYRKHGWIEWEDAAPFVFRL